MTREQRIMRQVIARIRGREHDLLYRSDDDVHVVGIYAHLNGAFTGPISSRQHRREACVEKAKARR